MSQMKTKARARVPMQMPNRTAKFSPGDSPLLTCTVRVSWDDGWHAEQVAQDGHLQPAGQHRSAGYPSCCKLPR